MGENHERGKNNLASGTARDTQRESTRSVCHFWTLVFGQRREVQIGLLFFCSGRLRRPLQKMLFFVAAD
jgi:hypothetical protein